jgi:RNA polymerase sigma-70 factor (sigma-E family)
MTAIYSVRKRRRLSRAVGERAMSDRDADEAVSQLYASHYVGLVRLSYLLIHDHGRAEELVQDAFVAMHGRWHRLREPHKALAYLRQAVVNRSRSELRHRAVVDRNPVNPPPPHESAEDTAVAHSIRADLLAALDRLPRRQREVLVLRYYLDLSEADIADSLSISRGSVKSHSSRGIAALRTVWGAVR